MIQPLHCALNFITIKVKELRQTMLLSPRENDIMPSRIIIGELTLT